MGGKVYVSVEMYQTMNLLASNFYDPAEAHRETVVFDERYKLQHVSFNVTQVFDSLHGKLPRGTEKDALVAELAHFMPHYS